MDIKRIADTHVHLWDSGQVRIPWLRKPDKLAEPHLVEEFHAAEGDLPVRKLVFVECGVADEERLKEVAWVTELARTEEPRIQAIVAAAAVETGEAVGKHLDKLQPNPLVKGIRRLIQGEELGFCVRPEFMRGVRLLSRFDYSFDLCIRHEQMHDALRLVSHCPDVLFILDHIGKPDIKRGRWEPWAKQIKEMARMENAVCKISGLATEADHEKWTFEDLRPYILHVIDCFGIDRVMYGGDWPVSTRATEYGRWVETLARAVEDASAEERDQLFYRNALRVYRMKDD